MKIRTLLCATMALTFLGSSTVLAQWEDDRDQNRHWQHSQQQYREAAPHHWARGERLPDQYRNRQYEVTDWRARHWRRPPHGYHYVRTDEGDVVLAAIATGVVADILLNQR